MSPVKNQISNGVNLKYLDAHCHLQFEQYAEDETQLVDRMHEDGVAGIVVGVDVASSKKAIALAEKHEHIFASVGLHPNYLAEESFDEKEFRALVVHPKVVAIGECGLDYFRPTETNEEVKRIQSEALYAHIALAAEVDKPLIIHSRPSRGTQDSYHDLIVILQNAKKEYPKLRGDIHFFVGGIAEAQALFALDFMVSFTAVITFARDYDAVIKAIPPTHILCETDSPFVAPLSRRGKRNDPLSVPEIVSKIAEIRDEDPETVRVALLENAKRLFAFA